MREKYLKSCEIFTNIVLFRLVNLVSQYDYNYFLILISDSALWVMDKLSSDFIDKIPTCDCSKEITITKPVIWSQV